MCRRFLPIPDNVEDRRREPMHFTLQGWKDLCARDRAQAGKILGSHVLILSAHDEYMKEKAASHPGANYFNMDEAAFQTLLAENNIDAAMSYQATSEFFFFELSLSLISTDTQSGLRERNAATDGEGMLRQATLWRVLNPGAFVNFLDISRGNDHDYPKEIEYVTFRCIRGFIQSYPFFPVPSYTSKLLVDTGMIQS